MSTSESELKKSSDAPVWIAGTLMVAVMAVFGQTLRHDFLYYDDPVYIGNAMVSQGLTWAGVKWSFTAVVGNTWLPLTLISHMIDVQLFGMRPGLHHFMNVLLHAANAALAFLALRRLTGDLWKSALVAALFALHPLRAESVAWASERKDVLCATFFFLGLWAYARYAETRKVRDYALVAVALLLGLCAKPMLVTFPFVLLLLDFWPLRRIVLPGQSEQRQPLRALIIEKIPLFAIVALISWVAYRTQSMTGAVGSVEEYPLRVRMANAIASYVEYVKQTIWPVDLAVMYPHPGTNIESLTVIVFGAALLLMTIAALFVWQQRPYVLTGWFWFVGMLIPVIGLVQIGNTAHADRYTYLPQIGLLVAFVWAAADNGKRFPMLGRVLPALSGLVVIVVAALCYRQVSFWRNTITLFEHTVAVSPDSAQAHFNLGSGYAINALRPDLAEPHFRRALELDPNGMGTKLNLAAALIELKRPQEAEELLRELIDYDAYQIEYYVLLAAALYDQAKFADGLFYAKEALRIEPEYARAQDILNKCSEKLLAPVLPLN